MTAGCHIPLPKDIANKEACIHPQNMENKCMFFVILARLYTQKRNPQRFSVKYLDEINTKEFSFL